MMTNIEVVRYIAEEKILKDLILKIGVDEDAENLKDLEQDLYIELLNRDDNLLYNLFLEKKLKYYLSRLVCNNIRSKNSRYYYRYKKQKFERDLSKITNGDED